jgi:SAM-dependent methyltransferase
MLVPLYEAVYEHLEVGTGTRLLALGCGSGLALLMAAARGATVTGIEADPERLALARERLLPAEPPATARQGARRAVREGIRERKGAHEGVRQSGTRLLAGTAEDAADRAGDLGFTMVTALDPQSYVGSEIVPALAAAAAMAERGSPVVLAGWGPAERCATASVLRVAARLADPVRMPGGWRPCGRDSLEETALEAGLRLDGSGRVACPFGYADLDSAVRGMLSTGLFDEAVRATDQEQVDKELAEALHPHLRKDGTVWMPNVFRYLIARV